MKPLTELATRIARTLISYSNQTSSIRSWSPQLEKSLHQLGCRYLLSPHLVSLVIDPFLTTHPALALGFFNWASQQPQFVHDSISYRSIVKALSISRQFNVIESILKQAKSQRIVFDGKTYSSLIESLILGGRTRNALWIFNEVKSMNCTIGDGVCNSLLAALTMDEYLDDAEKMFDEMCIRGTLFTTMGFGVFIWKFCRTSELGKICSMLDKIKRGFSETNGSVIALLIVDALCKTLRVKEAMVLLNELRIRCCKPDFMAYRIVAESIRLTGDVVETDNVLKLKRKLGVAPRECDYKVFILDLISKRHLLVAKELGEIIVNGNFSIDDDVLNALIGSVSAICPNSSITFLKHLIGKGKSPTLLTLNNLSKNLCKHGKIDELVEVFRVLSKIQYFNDMESYSLMVSFLCRASRLREAYCVLQEMKKKGFTSSVSLYNSLLEACCKDDLLSPAKRLWDEMFANRCEMNLKTHNILICKFSQVGEIEEAMRIFYHMLEKGVIPDTTTYTSLLEGLCKENKVKDVFKVLRKAVQQDEISTQVILNIFILNLCKNGHPVVASELLRDVSVDMRHLDMHVVLLKCLAHAKEIPIAIAHVNWVKDNSPLLSQAISEQLLCSTPTSNQGPILQLVHTAQLVPLQLQELQTR